MSLHQFRLPSLKDKHREMSNAEIAAETEKLKKETKKDNKVEKKK